MSLQTGLVAFWEFENTSWTDATGRGNDLTGNGSPAPGTTAGLIGNAVALAASNSQYLSHASNSDLAYSGDFSVQGWIYFDGIRKGTLIEKQGTVFGDGEWSIFNDFSTGDFYFGINVADSGGGSGNISLQFNKNISGGNLNTWYHVVLTWDSATNTAVLYVNSVAATINGSTNPAAHSGVFAIGHAGGPDFTGDVDLVGLWKGRILSAGDVSDLYNGEAGLSYAAMAGAAPLIAGWWPQADERLLMRAPRRFENGPPALALTPATLPPRIAGMAWRQPLDELPCKRRVDWPHPGPAITLAPPALLTQLKGIPWFEPPDDLPRKRRVDRPEPPPALALTPATLPPRVAGMAWFEPLDVYVQRRAYGSEPPAFGRALQGVPVSGMAWFTPPDIVPARRFYQDRPAFLQPITQAAAAALFHGWQRPAEDAWRPARPLPLAPPAYGAPSFVPPPVWTWSPQDVAPSKSRGFEHPAAQALSPLTPSIGVAWAVAPEPLLRRFKLVDLPPAQALLPLTQLIGVAWASPPEQLPRQFKLADLAPALALTPGTLPPRIAGMAWFAPPDVRPVAIFRPHPEPGFAFGVMVPVTRVAVLPISASIVLSAGGVDFALSAGAASIAVRAAG